MDGRNQDSLQDFSLPMIVASERSVWLLRVVIYAGANPGPKLWRRRDQGSVNHSLFGE